MVLIHNQNVCKVLCYLIVQICLFDLEQRSTDWGYRILYLVNVVNVLFSWCHVLTEVVWPPSFVACLFGIIIAAKAYCRFGYSLRSLFV